MCAHAVWDMVCSGVCVQCARLTAWVCGTWCECMALCGLDVCVCVCVCVGLTHGGCGQVAHVCA